MSHKKTWRKLKCILPSERNQYEEAKYYMIPTVWHTEKGKTMDAVNKHQWFQGVGRGKGRMNRPGTEQFFLEQLKCSVLSG